MTETPDPSNAPDASELQFDKVEVPSTTGTLPSAQGPACVACRLPIADAYFAAGEKLICPRCRDLYVNGLAGGSRVARVAKATVLGLGAGLLGAAIWYAVRKITHFEIGLVAIVVGFLVGRAVRTGSGNRGGRGYQILAVVLTYFALSATYLPLLVEMTIDAIQKRASAQPAAASPADATSPEVTTGDGSPIAAQTPAATQPAVKAGSHNHVRRHKGISAVIIAVLLLLFWALKAPIILGMHSPLGFLIACFALWEAWKINARKKINLAGPYSIHSGGAQGAQAGAQL